MQALASPHRVGPSFRLAGYFVVAWTAGMAPALCVDAPVFDPGESDSLVTFPVVITSTTPGAAIHYTLTGAEPTTNDPVIATGNSVTITRSLTLKAKAWSGSETSTTTSASYRLTGSVAPGAHHVLSLTTEQAVKSWGLQTGGRLGDGVATSTTNATPSPALYSAGVPVEDAVWIGAGLNSSAFIKNNGTVWTFGTNADGQLGDNTLTNRSYPVQVKTGTATYLANAVAVDVGNNFAGALTSGGNVYTWGDQTGGRLASGQTTGPRKLAAPAKTSESGNPDLDQIVSFDVGGGFMMAREASAMEVSGGTGNVWVWGHNGVGQLGLGNTTNRGYAFQMLASSGVLLADAWCVSAGESHSVVVRWKANDPDLQGTVWCAGEGANGRLGRGSITNSSYPVRVEISAGVPLEGISMVAAGSAHTLALTTDGKVWSWGRNTYGALGDGTLVDKDRAVQVKNPDGTGFLGEAGPGDPPKIIYIAAGGEGANNTSYAVAEDGRLYGWGRDDHGELGDGSPSTAATTVPVLIPGSPVIPGYPTVGLSHSIVQGIAPGAVTLTATPNDLDGMTDIAKVEFYSQGIKIHEATASPWQYNMTSLSAGTYHVYAVVMDDGGHEGESAEIIFEINEPDPNSDLDGDGVIRADELVHGTDPADQDTDDDGMADGYEIYYALLPLSPSDGLGANLGPHEDLDSDGMPNKDEGHRGTLPSNPNEMPPVTGSGASRQTSWWGPVGVSYRLQYSTDPGMAGAVTHPTIYNGNNAKITVALSTLVSPTPDPLYVCLLAESDVPQLTLGVSGQNGVAPEQVTMTPVISNPSDTADIDLVDFYVNGVLVNSLTAPPFTHTTPILGSGNYEFQVVVTDQQGRRGWSNKPVLAVADPLADSDSDGLPDYWEIKYFGALSEDSNDDHDGDGLSNSYEFAIGADPAFKDGDLDGWLDTRELAYFGDLDEEPYDDYDSDGLSNIAETDVHGSNPTLADSNADGINDGNAFQIGISLLGNDSDGDGISNANELAAGTDLGRADTDGDGVPDNLDYFPLDPNESNPGPGGSLSGPPTITVVSPPGAVRTP